MCPAFGEPSWKSRNSLAKLASGYFFKINVMIEKIRESKKDKNFKKGKYLAPFALFAFFASIAGSASDT